ncbi:MAG: hypothetical protein WCJ74_01265 [bacterium]
MNILKLTEIDLGSMSPEDMKTLMTFPRSAINQYEVLPNIFLDKRMQTVKPDYWYKNTHLGRFELVAVNSIELGIGDGNIKHSLITQEIAKLGLIPPPQSVIPAIVTQLDISKTFALLNNFWANKRIDTYLLSTKENAVRRPELYTHMFVKEEGPPSWETLVIYWYSSLQIKISTITIFQGSLKSQQHYPADLVESFEPIVLCIRKID